MATQTMPEVAARMNAIPKIVFSQTLESADWHNTTLLKNDLIGTIGYLKHEAGPDITILGNGRIVTQLAKANLIDIYQAAIIPVALGSGQAIFSGIRQQQAFTLTNTRLFANGSVVLWYRPR